MSDITHPDSMSALPRPGSDHRSHVPESSTLPTGDKAAPAVVDLLNHVVQGAHHTIDHLADSAAPTVQQLGESVSAAEDALHAKTAQLRDTRDEWVHRMRTRVRGHPLACVAAAFAVGAVIARITR